MGGEWDNCNSIINKYIFFKKKKKQQIMCIGEDVEKLEPCALLLKNGMADPKNFKNIIIT